MNKTVQKFTKNLQGFTLVELLIVIAIIAILAVVVAVIINPLELRRRANDSTRLADLANLQQAINIAVQEATSSGVGILCVSQTSYSSTACSGSSQTGTRNSNGTGWVKVNLASQNAVSIPVLPIDPVNDANYHYRFCSAAGDIYELNAKLESATTNGPKMTNDGGSDPALYEIGSSLTIMGTTDCPAY